jgi:hypothetical protein
MINTRTDFIYSTLDAYAMWVPQNLEAIQRNARISETLLPPAQWTQMFGLDMFCEQHSDLIKPYHTRSKKDVVEFMRETLSREVCKKTERLWQGSFATSFPGIMSKTVRRQRRKAKRTVSVPATPPINVYAAATAVDSISQSLGTQYQEKQMTVTDLVNSIAGTGMKITIEPV